MLCLLSLFCSLEPQSLSAQASRKQRSTWWILSNQEAHGSITGTFTRCGLQQEQDIAVDSLRVEVV